MPMRINAELVVGGFFLFYEIDSPTWTYSNSRFGSVSIDRSININGDEQSVPQKSVFDFSVKYT